ncbi:MAG: radical SAM protein [Deltaproteobacteria bacterium]|nr:radical SAM protein [Deltaproteobacteria bacterium]MBW2341375.1 radical SAM protein [Deltaproteobacteria bacterium]
MKPTAILINPWVYDFAAYDLWAKPLGLLYLAGRLRKSGFTVHLIDCLDAYHALMEETPDMKKPVRRRYGTGKFWKQNISKPPQLSTIPRAYSRYGITPQVFTTALKQTKRPEAIFITSLMTYWYPGVFEAVHLAKHVYPDVPVILGGIYATLCPEHASSYSGADFVISSPSHFWPGDLTRFLKKNIPDFAPEEKLEAFLPYPAFDLLTKIDYVSVLGSSGCPFRCPYCASSYLHPQYTKREPLELFEEVLFWHREYDVIDFAFYDDALLVDADTHISLFLEKIVRNNFNLRFHCPNGLHITYIDQEIANLLYKAGFKSIRLGLETADIEFQKRLGRKFSEGEFQQAVEHLKRAGFTTDQIGSYVLIGLPGQTGDQVAETMTYAGRMGTMPYLSEYSPIPHTAMWKEAVAVSRFDLVSDPIFHNNSIIPCWDGDVFEKVSTLKAMVKEIRDEARKK